MRISLLSLIVLLLAGVSVAKEKQKAELPGDVLRARTVMVVIAPDAGEPLNDPQANARAQDEVEKALMRWRRFEVVSEPSMADLVISVRKGAGNTVSPTIKGGPIDQRPVIVQPTDGSIRLGGHTGQPTGASGQDPIDEHPHMSTEYGGADDAMEVYRGKRSMGDALDSPAVWRYRGKDGFKPPKVTAVEQFRKAVVESEKAEAKNQP